MKMNDSIHICMVDDDPDFLRLFANQIHHFASTLQIQVSISSFTKYNASIRNYDLYFIDIEMPELDGYSITKLIPDVNKKSYIQLSTSIIILKLFQTVYMTLSENNI